MASILSRALNLENIAGQMEILDFVRLFGVVFPYTHIYWVLFVYICFDVIGYHFNQVLYIYTITSILGSLIVNDPDYQSALFGQGSSPAYHSSCLPSTMSN